MARYAILQDKQVVPTSFNQWLLWFDDTDRVIDLSTFDDGTEVSTVFLGINHGFSVGDDKWFETMIFGGQYDQECIRYETYEQAKAGHQFVVERLKQGLLPERSCE